MTERAKEAVAAIAHLVKEATENLKKDPLGVYILKDIEKRLRQTVNEKYIDIDDVKFLMFFYENFIYHLWGHIAADASLRITDLQAWQIITKVREGLDILATALEKYDKGEIYDALKHLISNYLKELNKESTLEEEV